MNYMPTVKPATIYKILVLFLLAFAFFGFFFAHNTVPAADAAGECTLGPVQVQTVSTNFCATYNSYPSCGGDPGDVVPSNPGLPCRPLTPFCLWDFETKTTNYRIITSCTPVVYHTLTVQSSGASNVAMTGAQGGTTNPTSYTKPNIVQGTDAVVTAPLTKGSSTFVRWTGCSTLSGGSNETCTRTMDADRTVTAEYSSGPITYVLTVKSSGASNVTMSGPQGGTTNPTSYTKSGLASGSTAQVTAPLTKGAYTFTSWSGCSSASGTLGSTCTRTISADRTVTANYIPSVNSSVSYVNYDDIGSFRADQFSIFLRVSGPSTVNPGETFNVNGEVWCSGDDFSGSQTISGYLTSPREDFGQGTSNCPLSNHSSVGSKAIVAPLTPGTYTRNFWVYPVSAINNTEVAARPAVIGSFQYTVLSTGPACYWHVVQTNGGLTTYDYPIPASVNPVDIQCQSAFRTCSGATEGDYYNCGYDLDGDPVQKGNITCVCGPTSFPQCSDGVDNDGDTLIDMADPGCDDPNDPDETDPPVPIDPPIVDLLVNGSNAPAPVTSGTAVNVRWINGGTINANGCVASGSSGWSGVKNPTGGGNENHTPPSAGGNYTYTLTCVGPDGPDSDTVTVQVTGPTLSVAASTNPVSGTAPLNNVNVTGNVAGTATGNIQWKIDCTDDGTWEQTVTNTSDPYTATNLCNYSSSGTYRVRVQATRQGVTASDTTVVTVSAAPPTLSVTASANPSSGTAPLNNVDITGNVSGTATGNIQWKIDCTSDGTWDYNVTNTSDPYTAVNICSYPSSAGSPYTVRVQAVRQGLTAETTTSVNVNPAPAVLDVSPDPLDFGDTQTGTTKTLILTARNTGGGSLTINANPVISGAFAAKYACISASCSSPHTLAGGASVAYTVRYAPTAVSNDQTASLALAGTFSRNVALTGNGTAAPPPLPTARYTSPLTVTIVSGNSTGLVYTSTDADPTGCQIIEMQGGTPTGLVYSGLGPSGTQTVSPTATSQYRLRCSNATGVSADNANNLATVNVTAAPACSDGSDNDGDGLVDMADPGCSGPNDPDETDPPLPPDECGPVTVTINYDASCQPVEDDCTALEHAQYSNAQYECPIGSGNFTSYIRGFCVADVSCGAGLPQCSDGSDNDGDGLTDYPNDPGCSDPTDNDETDPPQCSDTSDNDGDGFIDMADPGCSSPSDNDETDPPPPDPPVVSLRVNGSHSPSPITIGPSVDITWTNGGTINANGCVASGSSGWSGTKNPTGGGSDTHTPSTTGTLNYTLTCIGPDGSDSDTVTLTVNALPVLNVTPASMDFGTLVSGESSTKTFTVTNTGGSTLTGSVTGPFPPFTCLSGCSAFSLTSSQTHTVRIQYVAPTTGGPSWADTVNFTSNGGNTNRTITGTAAFPKVSIVAQPNQVLKGRDITISWTAENIQSIRVEKEVVSSGAITVLDDTSYPNVGSTYASISDDITNVQVDEPTIFRVIGETLSGPGAEEEDFVSVEVFVPTFEEE